MRPGFLFVIAWTGFILTWLVAAFWSAPAERRAAGPDVWAYRLTLLAGGVLFYHRTSEWLAAARLWHVGYIGAYALAALTFCGFMLAWWARVMLGPLWSGAVTSKRNHRIVDRGPYALVRHPIYTGIIVASLATAAAKATIPALAGCALIAIGLWLKARVEERFLACELGPQDYASYRRRVPMLVPFLPGGE